jgi:hypothetical protein
MDDTTWQQARLIPVSGLNGADEQERRGTSALLAVLSSVKEYGRAVTAALGAPAGPVETFIEVPFTTAAGKRACPDGLIRVSRGNRTFVALVEVKTGKNTLEPTQIECYLDVAKDNRYDAVLTISNEISSAPGVHPCTVDKRKLRKVALHHMSWSQLHTLAVMEQLNHQVADPDQAWILKEYVRYLEHPKSGAIDFDDMGPEWVSVRDAVGAGTLRSTDKGAIQVVTRFDQLIAFAGMRLSRHLGVTVLPALTRLEVSDVAGRRTAHVMQLVETGRLTGGLRIPNAIAPMQISVDLRASKVSASIAFSAPEEGRPVTRVNWLLRQLRDSPEDLRVEALTPRTRGAGTAELLRALRGNPNLIVEDPKRDIRTFSLTLTRPAGSKRGQGRGSFVSSVLDLVDAFYRDVVQVLKPWTPAAPKVKGTGSDDERLLVPGGAKGEQEQPQSGVAVFLPAQPGARDESAAAVWPGGTWGAR